MEDTIFRSVRAYKEWLAKESRPFSATAQEIVDRAKRINAGINAFIAFDDSVSRARAESVGKNRGAGRLSGVPVAIKDNICVKGELTTSGSKILDGFRPQYNATVIEKLEKAGAFLMPRANMDEFAFGSSCETSFYGPTKNPRDITRIPGGSSGGAAASVAGAQVVASLGSDTGGSIRQPAAMCGVVGMKPTYGRVSRYGLMAFASSLDQIGPITNNVEDCAIMLEVISGYDDKDSTSVDTAVPKYTEKLNSDVKGMTIGIPKEYFTGGIDSDVLSRIEDAIKVLKGLGAKTLDISLPHTKYAVACYYIIGPAEASSNLARYDGVHYGYRSPAAADLTDVYVKSRTEGFGQEAKRRILLGTYALSSGYYDAYYLKALKVRTMIANDFKEAFKSCDVILTPTAPTVAFKLGEKLDDPLKMYLSDIFTIPANLAGIPTVSVPCGPGKDGLPVGLQIMAKPFDEENLIRAAHAYERGAAKI
jgi:aspartyl-tRNA(Asn)/glutamyl-tRNA(Gln) amidotransferase subunit A